MSKFFYIIHIQYLGFRFHGWAKQPNVKTVHHMIDKTLSFVLGHRNFKTLGSSRTDAMVSANHAVFELFIEEPLDKTLFMAEFNRNLPTDIRAIRIESTDADFNIIQTPRIKEYLYCFSFGEKCHPFSAPFIASFADHMNIEMMSKGAKLFEGTHNFRKYCTKPSGRENFTREIKRSYIAENDCFQASFFPAISYCYHIHASGFMRNQIRLMMGQLIKLGREEISLADLEQTLTEPDDVPLDYIAPSAGLILNEISFEDK